MDIFVTGIHYNQVNFSATTVLCNDTLITRTQLFK